MVGLLPEGSASPVFCCGELELQILLRMGFERNGPSSAPAEAELCKTMGNMFIV